MTHEQYEINKQYLMQNNKQQNGNKKYKANETWTTFSVYKNRVVTIFQVCFWVFKRKYLGFFGSILIDLECFYLISWVW